MTANRNPLPLLGEIESAPVGRLCLTVTILAFLVAAFDGMDAQLIAFAAPDILREFRFGKDQLGLIFSAGTAGMAAGAMLFGPLGDRYGRRLMTIVAVAEFSICTGLTLYASGYGEFLLIRFLAGLGMGGAMPNAVTLTAEYAPAKHRRMIVTFMYSGFAVGGLLGGGIANLLLDSHGWRYLFLAGALLPALLAVALWAMLPESPLFLARLGESAQARLGQLMQRLHPAANYPPDSHFHLPDAAASEGMASLFGATYRRNTLLLWIAFFINLFVLFFLIFWTPVLLEEEGISGQVARNTIITFSIGGLLGAFLLAMLSNRFNARVTLAIYFVIGFAAVFCIGLSLHSMALLFFFTLAMGLSAGAAQTGLYPVATQVYGAANRVTGVGWAQAMGRVGSILGPWFGGLAVAAGWGFFAVYALFAVPLLAAGAAIWMMNYARSAAR